MSSPGTNKGGTGAVRIPKTKKLSVRQYREWWKRRAKAKRSVPTFKRKRKLREVNGTEPNDSEEDDTTNSDSFGLYTRLKRVDLLLKWVKSSSNAEKRNISNESTRTKFQKRMDHISQKKYNMDGSKLQENVIHSVENARKSSPTKFVEYWVPVRLSNVQTELYCGSLFTNSEVLCSSVKHYKSETLHNVLVSTRKCCDHPKLVDSFLRESLLRRIPEPEKYDAEIKLSSKLLLLQRILQEISKRGLRVVILYQSLGGSGPIHTDHILDDIIHEKFGEDSFVHIGEGSSSRSNRQAVLNTYNEKGNGKFICLMATRACVRSIHLKSVDVVIFFNSDWDPMNDLRALQKIKLDSQHEHVKVFRLYSAYTVEEKLLMLAKQSKSPEGSIIRQSTCHGLLNWGAYYLFEKLDEFHGSTTDGTHSDADSFVEDVFLELSNLLPNNEEISGCKFIVEVEQIGGLYPRNICLLGEVEYPLMKNYSIVEEMILNEPPYSFWINLLQGRNPNWKYFSSELPRTRKRAQRFNARTEARMRSINELQGEAAASTTRQSPMLRTPSPTESRSPDEQDLQTCTQSQELQPVTELQRELERLEKQKTELLKLYEDKKLQAKMAREKEIDEINIKYDTLLQNADIAFVEERRVLDTTYNKVLANKSLAEAMLQRENSDLTQGSTMNLMPSYQLSEASPSLHLSASPPDPMHNLHITFSGNIQPSHQMMAPAPHLRHMVRSLPPPQPFLLSHRPEICFSPVSLQPIAQSRRS